MEVLVGPPYTMDVTPACSVRDRTASAAQDKLVSASSSLFLKDADAGGAKPRVAASSYGSDDDSSDSSSSIGDPGDSDDEENDEEVCSEQQNKLSLDSLEDSLPVKRGLSNHFTGKSKSFGNLLEVESSTSRVKDVEKPENPFNKRRRLLLANKWSRKSFYAWQNPKSMPLLPSLNEEEEEEDDDHLLHKQHPQDHDDHHQDEVKTKTLNRPKFGFKSQSCFSLSDLQEDEEDDQ